MMLHHMSYRRAGGYLIRNSKQNLHHLSEPVATSLRSLYEQTSGRWLYNDKEQHSIRHVQFNVSELTNVACATVGASSCTDLRKIAEGSFNKIFRMRFDNRKTAIARIPSSRMLGENGVSWMTASEVTTMRYANSLNIRTPGVLAWSKDKASAVGSPYIILEDVDGVPLNEEWFKPATRGDPVGAMLHALANYVGKLHLPALSAIGSLYFRDDVPAALARPIFVPKHAGVMSSFGVDDTFCIGPMAEQMWWRAYHDEPHFHRGPFDNLEEYFRAAVNLERRAVHRHREDPTSLRYTKSTIEDLREVEILLDKVEALIPYIPLALTHEAPNASRLMQNVVGHPDLRAANVIVPHLREGNAVERMRTPTVIDWQGAVSLPLALQYKIPDAFTYNPSFYSPDLEPMFKISYPLNDPPFPDGMDQMTGEQRDSVCAEHRLVCRQLGWMNTLNQRAEYEYLHGHPVQPYLASLTRAILRACADGPVELQALLVLISEEWQDEAWGICPYSFSDEALEAHWQGAERNQKFDFSLAGLTARLHCDVEGWVPNEHYQQAVNELDMARREWDEAKCGGPFPFEEGSWAQFLR